MLLQPRGFINLYATNGVFVRCCSGEAKYSANRMEKARGAEQIRAAPEPGNA